MDTFLIFLYPSLRFFLNILHTSFSSIWWPCYSKTLSYNYWAFQIGLFLSSIPLVIKWTSSYIFLFSSFLSWAFSSMTWSFLMDLQSLPTKPMSTWYILATSIYDYLSTKWSWIIFLFSSTLSNFICLFLYFPVGT